MKVQFNYYILDTKRGKKTCVLDVNRDELAILIKGIQQDIPFAEIEGIAPLAERLITRINRTKKVKLSLNQLEITVNPQDIKILKRIKNIDEFLDFGSSEMNIYTPEGTFNIKYELGKVHCYNPTNHTGVTMSSELFLEMLGLIKHW